MLGLFVVAIAARLFKGVPQRQTMVLFGVQAVLILALGLTIWFLFFSRLKRSFKVIGLILAGIPLLVGFMLFEFDGFTGDMMPRFKPRGSEPTALKVHDAPPGMRGEFPQFGGPTRDGIMPSLSILEDWKNNTPLLAWRRPVGAGWSSFVVSGTRAITMEQAGEEEALVCYNTEDGEERWRATWPGRYDQPPAGIGPRSTPSIASTRPGASGDVVVAIGAEGHVVCVGLQDGATRWSAELSDIGKGSRRWGYAASPLILTGDPNDAADDVVVCVAGGDGPDGKGGLLVAYELDSGKVAWSGSSGSHHYSSPVLAELAGKQQILLFARNRLLGVELGTGNTLWETPCPEGGQCIAQPLVLPGNQVMVSSGYGVGATVFEISGGSAGGFVADKKWSNNKLKAKFSSMVANLGLVYGLDDGILVCIEPISGERLWKKGRYGHGHLLCLGEQLLIQAESGDVVLVALPNGEEQGRFKALKRRTWNPAALAGNQLFVRNDREAACFLLPLK